MNLYVQDDNGQEVLHSNTAYRDNKKESFGGGALRPGGILKQNTRARWRQKFEQELTQVVEEKNVARSEWVNPENLAMAREKYEAYVRMLKDPESKLHQDVRKHCKRESCRTTPPLRVKSCGGQQRLPRRLLRSSKQSLLR